VSEYRPGACNIGPRQRRRRAQRAAAAAAVAVGIVAAQLLGVLPDRLLLVGTFVPLALAFEWAIQARESFCVGLALLGRHDVGTDDGEATGRVAEPNDRRADQLYATKITATSVLLAGLVTALLVVLL
jgi:hypothetical protein